MLNTGENAFENKYKPLWERGGVGNSFLPEKHERL